MKVNLTKKSIFEALAKNDFGETTFTLTDGSKAVIDPCWYGPEKRPTEEDIEFYLVYCEGLPYLSDSKLDKIVQNLNNIIELRTQSYTQKINLLKYFALHEENGWDDESWGFYSDFHKDVYGYRPHGKVCGVYIDPNEITK